MIDLLKTKETILLDGGMGTSLQKAGLTLGQRPELLCLERPALVESIQRSYAEAGSRILYTNTFGASPKRMASCGADLEQVIAAAVRIARRAGEKTGAKVALDIGPLGELMAPAGTLGFEEACNQFKTMIRAGTAAGADLVALETFTDLYELKAAILAVKESCDRPLICSMSFERDGRTFTGCTVESFAAVARGLGADAVGINCSLGPKEILPLARRLCDAVPGDFPVFVKPNAGLPRPDGSYRLTPQLFAMEMAPFRELGLFAVGGCCGTTPDHLRWLAGEFKDCPAGRPDHPLPSVLCTPVICREISPVTVTGERINPTGKPRLQQELREGREDFLQELAVLQTEQGADLLDVNVGVPGIDEPAAMAKAIRAVQAVTDLPLQIDSSNPAALEAGLRAYNGKPLVNSVNGEDKVLAAVLPLCKKYGAALIGLTMDETGIPKTEEQRLAIAKKIRDTALAYGIPKEDIYIDCLVLTVSAQQEGAMPTLRAMSRCKSELGVRTLLGITNISYGLPDRDGVNTAFLTMAMALGLDVAIMNTASEPMMKALRAWRVLSGKDLGCADYIEKYSGQQTAVPTAPITDPAHRLRDAVIRGLRADAAQGAKELLADHDPLEVIDRVLIPALDTVGARYEEKTLFLPQLLQAAAAAQSAFGVIRDAIAASGTAGESKGDILLATVQGDVHDIGKNIVKVILENYGFRVKDLGRDVPVETVVAAAKAGDYRLVGLSALMTTTVGSMERTIAALREQVPGCKIWVGGAVLTPDYAKQIGADFYCADAKESADLAKKIFAAP